MNDRPFFLYFLVLLVTIGCSDSPTGTTPEDINGILIEVGGIPLLRLWGTPQEQGFAHGYLIGDDIVSMLDDFLEHEIRGLTADVWENNLIP